MRGLISICLPWQGKDWSPHVVTDGKLVTGQNPQVCSWSAQMLLSLASEREVRSMFAFLRKLCNSQKFSVQNMLMWFCGLQSSAPLAEAVAKVLE